MIDLHQNSSVHRFDHEAMNTLFSLRIKDTAHDHAFRAAGACFRQLDRLEASLSRYRDGSDISRINALRAGESLFIEEETHACLQLAIQAGALTGGLFDVTLGARIEHRKRAAQGEPPTLRGKISLDPDRPRVVCIEEGRQIDLGGIGKGFSLDRMAITLQEHEISSALLSCSGSTLLAIGPTAWPVVLHGDNDQHEVELRDEALSASGIAFQGTHVVHPDGSENPYSFRRVWTVTSRAAVADAFSTACLLMDEPILAEFTSLTDELTRCFVEPVSAGKIIQVKPESA